MNKVILIIRGSPEEEAVTLNECLQVCFHRSCRHHLILLYPREMLILDLEINQTVGLIALDRSSSSFSKVPLINGYNIAKTISSE